MTFEKFEALWQAFWAYLYKVLASFGYAEKEDVEADA